MSSFLSCSRASSLRASLASEFARPLTGFGPGPFLSRSNTISAASIPSPVSVFSPSSVLVPRIPSVSIPSCLRSLATTSRFLTASWSPSFLRLSCHRLGVM